MSAERGAGRDSIGQSTGRFRGRAGFTGEGHQGAIRVGKWKAVWNTREGWRGAARYVAEAPRLFDLWQDPQERYDIFMTNWTEKTWMVRPIGQKTIELLATYKKYPNRPVQTLVLGGPEFYADDAIVQEQLRKIIHSISRGQVAARPTAVEARRAR